MMVPPPGQSQGHGGALALAQSAVDLFAMGHPMPTSSVWLTHKGEHGVERVPRRPPFVAPGRHVPDRLDEDLCGALSLGHSSQP